VLRTLGTLSIILAWILLILGIAAAIFGSWGISQLLRAIDLPQPFAGMGSLLGILPPLFWGIAGFLQFFVIGKVLQLLVGLDDAAIGMSNDLARQATNQQALTTAVLSTPSPAPIRAPEVVATSLAEPTASS
jgi:hypothetical protein